jgi:uncharacterized protein (TIGR02118 family)
MSGATAIVLYPRKEGATFDKEYYLSTHMELCSKYWKPLGLKSYAVTELNADGPYAYTVTLEWESHDAFGKATQDPNTKEIMEDVKNFSSETPVIVHGSVIGRG